MGETNMPGKLSKLAQEGGNGQLVAGIRDSAGQIWLAGLGAFAKAQKEGTKIFNALVEEGEEVQKQAKKTAEETYDDVKARASKSWDQFSWSQIERVFEDRVARALHSLSVPTRKDLETLSHRVAELTAVTKKLAAATDEPGSSRKARSHEAGKRA
jgi:poly(hydroxyalkanoate) granule-associated protein